MIWHIVGLNIPNNIKKLESKNIKVEGFLSDEDLHSLYQKLYYKMNLNYKDLYVLLIFYISDMIFKTIWEILKCE